MKNPPALRHELSSYDAEVRELHKYASLADAKNTQRAYTSDWKHFLSWCKKRNKAPLPASPDDIAMYIRFCAENQKLKISTVRRRLSAISEAHSRNRYVSPTKEWVVRNTLRRLMRELGSPAKGKRPILSKALKTMVAHCPPTLPGIRDKALLLIGFAGAFRRSELVGLNFDDVTVADEGLVIMIRGSKTDQKREGRKVAIPFGKDPLTCPVKALLDWLDDAQIMSGPLFRSMTKSEHPRPTRMADRTVADGS